jgi:hypothetical protein
MVFTILSLYFFINDVIARPNMLYIFRFGPYRPHDFVPGDAGPLLSLTPQNTYNMLATSTTNKASYQTLTRRCGILQILSVYIDRSIPLVYID